MGLQAFPQAGKSLALLSLFSACFNFVLMFLGIPFPVPSRKLGKVLFCCVYFLLFALVWVFLAYFICYLSLLYSIFVGFPCLFMGFVWLLSAFGGVHDFPKKIQQNSLTEES